MTYAFTTLDRAIGPEQKRLEHLQHSFSQQVEKPSAPSANHPTTMMMMRCGDRLMRKSMTCAECSTG